MIRLLPPLIVLLLLFSGCPLTTRENASQLRSENCRRLLQNTEASALVQTALVQNFLRESLKSRHAVVIGQTLVRLLQAYPDLTFRELEKNLRKMNEPFVFLVAIPSHHLPESIQNLGAVASLNPITKKEMPFYLWIGTNGPMEALEEMLAHGLDPFENLRNLENTGMIVAKDIP